MESPGRASHTYIYKYARRFFVWHERVSPRLLPCPRIISFPAPSLAFETIGRYHLLLGPEWRPLTITVISSCGPQPTKPPTAVHATSSNPRLGPAPPRCRRVTQHRARRGDDWEGTTGGQEEEEDPEDPETQKTTRGNRPC